ncbi:PIN domain-containing protein [Actinobacteria bacterium YIM 96077]|uniref:Ribonuclease VapC n=1 Tax=Phytoactinopolyspora halophila TaxID=1981511 RepID=A0A329QUU9_9ACTN|nr:TA system VapC family ribonuclease toxin [Phytoactinopolyspora halophila]AYY14911.1 PIN domain-containing protein [Actinobacteria bacterium YIM 96077]RAW15369.1 VapC toxin family PIN domain ribonuclease [Phytoactinopolyspora halophila]
MIALDTNILVYAHRQDSEFHSAAAQQVKALAEDIATWAIPWPCIHEFFAIATHPKIYDPPSTTEQAIIQIEAWLQSPSLTVLGEPHGYWNELKTLLDSGKIKGSAVHDARIAALCSSHGVRELWSADRDFSRFPSLRVRNPLLQQ